MKYAEFRMSYIGSGYDLDNVMLLENIKYSPILSFHTILSFRTSRNLMSLAVNSPNPDAQLMLT